jgi:hypothetical protein
VDASIPATDILSHYNEDRRYESSTVDLSKMRPLTFEVGPDQDRPEIQGDLM